MTFEEQPIDAGRDGGARQQRRILRIPAGLIAQSRGLLRAVRDVEDDGMAKRFHHRLKVLHRERSWLGLKNFFGADLEKMKGDWKGWCSLRINDQYRIIFKWGKDNNAYDVDLTKHYQKANL